MTRPKFSVGEEVILVSETHPHYNGEYIVHKVLERGESITCRYTGFKLNGLISEQYDYLLDEVLLASNSQGVVVEGIVCESELRKKPKPSDISFAELVASIKAHEGLLVAANVMDKHSS